MAVQLLGSTLVLPSLLSLAAACEEGGWGALTVAANAATASRRSSGARPSYRSYGVWGSTWGHGRPWLPLWVAPRSAMAASPGAASSARPAPTRNEAAQDASVASPAWHQAVPPAGSTSSDGEQPGAIPHRICAQESSECGRLWRVRPEMRPYRGPRREGWTASAATRPNRPCALSLSLCSRSLTTRQSRRDEDWAKTAVATG